jgi:hypothetical protein
MTDAIRWPKKGFGLIGLRISVSAGVLEFFPERLRWMANGLCGLARAMPGE